VVSLGADTLCDRTVVKGIDGVNRRTVGCTHFISTLLILSSYEQNTQTLEISHVVKTVLARAI